MGREIKKDCCGSEENKAFPSFLFFSSLCCKCSSVLLFRNWAWQSKEMFLVVSLESITRVSWFWFSSCAKACFHTVRSCLGADEGVARQLTALAALSEDLSFVPRTLTTNQGHNCSRPSSRSNFGSWDVWTCLQGRPVLNHGEGKGMESGD